MSSRLRGAYRIFLRLNDESTLIQFFATLLQTTPPLSAVNTIMNFFPVAFLSFYLSFIYDVFLCLCVVLLWRLEERRKSCFGFFFFFFNQCMMALNWGFGRGEEMGKELIQFNGLVGLKIDELEIGRITRRIRNMN